MKQNGNTIREYGFVVTHMGAHLDDLTSDTRLDSTAAERGERREEREREREGCGQELSSDSPEKKKIELLAELRKSESKLLRLESSYNRVGQWFANLDRTETGCLEYDEFLSWWIVANSEHLGSHVSLPLSYIILSGITVQISTK
eukprot:SAG31_NODE_1918_length_6921_cov_2.015245_9_plen_145_part_00